MLLYDALKTGSCEFPLHNNTEMSIRSYQTTRLHTSCDSNVYSHYRMNLIYRTDLGFLRPGCRAGSWKSRREIDRRVESTAWSATSGYIITIIKLRIVREAGLAARM
jgi:hypothetical protein